MSKDSKLNNKVQVPNWAYKHASAAEISELEKFAKGLNDEIMKALPPEDKDAVTKEVAMLKRKKQLSAVLEKKANSFSDTAALLAGSALAPVVGHLAMRGVDRLLSKSKAQVQKDLQLILQVHPDIGTIDDPRVQMAYMTLLRLNPEYAADPLIAGPLLKQIVENRLNPRDPSSGSYIDPSIAIKLTEVRNKQETMRPGSHLGMDMGRNVSGAVGSSFSPKKSKRP